MNKKDIEFLENSVDGKTLKEYNDLLNCKNVNKQDLLVLLYSIYDFLNIIKIKYKRTIFDYYLFITAYNYYYLFSTNDDNLKEQAYLYKNSLKIVNYFSNFDVNINKVNNDNIKLKEITTNLKKTYKMN